MGRVLDSERLQDMLRSRAMDRVRLTEASRAMERRAMDREPLTEASRAMDRVQLTVAGKATERPVAKEGLKQGRFMVYGRTDRRTDRKPTCRKSRICQKESICRKSRTCQRESTCRKNPICQKESICRNNQIFLNESTFRKVILTNCWDTVARMDTVSSRWI